MERMSNVDYQLFTTMAKMTEKQLLKSVQKYVKKLYPSNKITVTKNYILCEGTIPIMLVAHMDTVFTKQPDEIFYDTKKHIMWSPQGLGADDRAGVFAILKILQKGYRPHICFTTEEERGGIGAAIMVSQIPQAPFDIKYIVELDRQGLCDCVFYQCENEVFTEFIENYGFVSDWGTFSDISVICPAWKVAGVNLSIGYRDEHSIAEILNVKGMYNTIDKVCAMLKNCDTAGYFEYIETPWTKYYRGIYGKYYSLFPEEDDDYDFAEYDSRQAHRLNFTTHNKKCCKCGKFYDENDVFEVVAKDGVTKKDYCIYCVDDNINWCNECGLPFETETPEQNVCKACLNKTEKGE